ncbi:MAG: hypothetical protein ABH829_04915 [archaeon]
MPKHKRAAIEIETVVVLSLAVIVLLLVGVFFSGGLRAAGSKLLKFSDTAVGNTAEKGSAISCNFWCLDVVAGLDVRKLRPLSCMCPGEDADVLLREGALENNEGGTLTDEDL